MQSYTYDPDLPDDSDSESLVSLPLFSPDGSIASSQTSYDVDASMRSSSPAPSLMSIGSSMLQQVYKQEFGRGLNNYSEVYRLPADDEELSRMDKQHAMIEEMCGKYPPPLMEVMADNIPGEVKACLDLGCGSGNWIMDIARDFPNCSAVAIDLVPMQSISRPPNLRSEVDDINLGLEHYFGDFNVVHARLIASGIKDYNRLIDQISRVLRPGGLIDVKENDFHAYDKYHRRIELDTYHLGPPWWARWLTFLGAAVKNSGGEPDAANHLYEWIATHPAFEDVVYREFWLPVIPSPEDTEFQHRISKTLQDVIFIFLRSGRPLLLGNGCPEQVVDELEYGVVEELRQGQIPQYTRLQCVYARKRQQ